MSPPQIVIGLNAVILAVTEEEPRILVVRRADHSMAFPPEDATPVSSSENVDALPFGPLDPDRDRTLELALRGWVREQTGVEVGYVEQLYTFGDRNRDPGERLGGPRVISVGYLTLGREGPRGNRRSSRWRAWYEYLPWEDWRNDRPTMLDNRLVPALEQWVAEAEGGERHLRRERVWQTHRISTLPDASRPQPECRLFTLPKSRMLPLHVMQFRLDCSTWSA